MYYYTQPNLPNQLDCIEWFYVDTTNFQPPKKGPIKKFDLQQGKEDNRMILYIVYNAIPPAQIKSRACE